LYLRLESLEGYQSMNRVRFVLFAMLAALPIAAAEMPQAGQTAPEFSLPSQDGSNIAIKEFRGRKTAPRGAPLKLTISSRTSRSMKLPRP
jgi:hypothetical protein